MDTDATAANTARPSVPAMQALLEQYGCGPIHFTGTHDALYERHLMFDSVLDARAAGPRERYEAIARSVRDVLSQRWVRTENTYDRENPKLIYYRSIRLQSGSSPKRGSTGSLYSNRSRMQVWAMAGSAAWLLASSSQWRRCSFRP
jgi:starch phosphorylase